MSKAEKRALEAYPYNRAYTDNDIEYDGNFCNRLPYIEGYEQAEKDLELTWDDISVLNCLLNEVEHEFKKGVHEDKSYKAYCQEVLKRFKERKE